MAPAKVTLARAQTGSEVAGASRSSRPTHANGFTAITIAASVLVACRHGVILLGPERETQPLLHAAIPLGIFVLFAVSGYLLVGSWERRPSLAQFALARVVRIFPALVLVVLLTVFVLGLGLTEIDRWDYLGSAQTAEYLLNLLLNPQYALPGVFVDNEVSQAVNGTLWSLPAQFACFFFVPLVAIARVPWVRAGIWIALAVAAASISSSMWAAETIVWGSQVSQGLNVWPSFFVAAAIATVRLRPPPVLTAVVIVAFGAILFSAPSAIHIGYWLLVPLATVGLGSLDIRGVRSAGRWGNPSYGVFLVGFPVQQTLLHVWPDLNAWLSVSTTLLVSLGYGYASNRLLERNVERLSRAWISRT